MRTFSFLLACTASAAVASAQTVLVTSDITTSTTWTSNNVYNLQQQIYVTNGATLTIEAGTRIASTANLGGSLAVARGAKIEALGTETAPIVFTSTNDNGTQRTGANEWGNLTVMGSAYISEDVVSGTTNQAFPDPGNYAFMEGLTGTGPDQRYGGGDDNDNSGTIKYCSFRFGGKVIALTNELNGLSLGGIGRGTTIHHVEVYNNVDDGIEIWGGTVEIHNALISHVGDDSFDCDQGWRGKASQICIVQGYSVNAKQGSGHGDNAFEVDGAEQSDYQPRTRAQIINATVIGAPQKVVGPLRLGGSDHATAWRDGAGVQYRNCVFQDVGQRVVSFDNTDGDGGAGYGFNGTPSWPAIWSIPDTTLPSVNSGTGSGAPSALYTAQSGGTVCEISDCVINNAGASDAFDQFTNTLGLNSGFDNVISGSMAIAAVTHGDEITTIDGPITRVTSFNPLPAGDALNAASVSEYGHNFRGAFVPGCNWAHWTAMAEFGVMTVSAFQDLGSATAGLNGNPEASGTYVMGGGATTCDLDNAAPGSLAIGILSLSSGNTNLAGFGYPNVNLIPSLFTNFANIVTFTNGSGRASFNLTLPSGPSGLGGVSVYNQFGILDAAAPQGAAASNATVIVVP